MLVGLVNGIFRLVVICLDSNVFLCVERFLVSVGFDWYVVCQLWLVSLSIYGIVVLVSVQVDVFGIEVGMFVMQ